MTFKNYKIYVMLILSVIILSACTGYRNVNVSEDGESRMLLTDRASEIEVPNHPQRVVLMRSVDIGNSLILDANVVGVSDAVRGSFLEQELKDRGVEFIEYGDIDAIRDLNPDMIVTFTQDVFSHEYETIAPTLTINPTPPLIMTPFRARQYLDHMFYIGVILNEEEASHEYADKMLSDHFVFRRDLSFDASQYNAIIISESDGKYFAHDQYHAYSTEAVYDILNFQMSSSVSRRVKNAQEFETDISEYNDLEYDFVFLLLEDTDIDEKSYADALDISTERLFVNNIRAFRLNDLMSVEKQTEVLIEQLNESYSE